MTDFINFIIKAFEIVSRCMARCTPEKIGPIPLIYQFSYL